MSSEEIDQLIGMEKRHLTAMVLGLRRTIETQKRELGEARCVSKYCMATL